MKSVNCKYKNQLMSSSVKQRELEKSKIKNTFIDGIDSLCLKKYMS